METEFFLSMPEDEKWWMNNSPIADELNDVPIISNKTKDVRNSEIIKLHKDITQLVCDFVRKHDIKDAFCLSFDIDDLQSLKEYGINCAACDSSLVIYDKDKNNIICSQ